MILLSNIRVYHLSKSIFYFASFAALILLIFGLYLEREALMLVPLLIAVIFLLILWPKQCYLYFFGILPFSIEVYFRNGLGTDLPTEPLILFFFAWAILILASSQTKVITLFDSPIILLLCAHLFWIFFTAIYAQYPFVSFKFFFAKLWYVLPFFFLSQKYLFDKADVQKWIRIFLAGLMISVVYVMIRHIGSGMGFSSISPSVSPFYRNHVNYAALLTISLPLCWLMIRSTRYKWGYTVLLTFLLIAIYFSYSRAAFVAVVLIVTASFLLKFKALTYSALFAMVISVLSVFYFSKNNRYLNLAPNYETTIAHTKFDNLVEATYKMEDISTMERVHRWVAGFNMLGEKPLLGFGANNFYFTYRPYTNNSFQTYVSNNPDKSGIHNYYLMTAVEQGIPGLLIFLSLIVAILYTGERLYHRLAVGFDKNLVHMALMVLVAVLGLIMINDLMEAVKVGPFFFVAAGIIVRMNRDYLD